MPIWAKRLSKKRKPVAAMRRRAWNIIAAMAAACAPVALGAALACPLPALAQGEAATVADSGTTALDGLAREHSGDIADGEYYLATSLGGAKVLDVTGASAADGANVEIWSANQGGAQRWSVTHDEKGYVVLKAECSGKALGVRGADTAPGANVDQWPWSSRDRARKWVAIRNGGAYTLVSALDRNLVLDVAWGNPADGANVQSWPANGTSGQSWEFIPTHVSEVSPSRGELPSGWYSLLPASDPSRALDVTGMSASDGTNIETFARNGSLAQVFSFAEQDGFYRIASAVSASAVDVANGCPVPQTNALLWSSAPGKRNQQFSARDNGDGTWTFVNRATGLALTAAPGGNVDVRAPDGSASQRFSLQAASNPAPALSTVQWKGARYWSGGRFGRDWQAIVIHISECSSLQEVTDIFHGDRRASAHFAVGEGQIAQYVNLSDTAWAVGNWEWNKRTVSIEHVGTTANPPTRATLDTSARLMAGLARLKGWTRLVVGENVGVHKWYGPTTCPATLDVRYLVSKANEYLGCGFTYLETAHGGASPQAAEPGVSGQALAEALATGAVTPDGHGRGI